MNCPDFRATGLSYRPLGVERSVDRSRRLPRIVDPDSFELLGPRSPGMLLVNGPNVMSGYLGQEDLTAQAIRDGWYITGDIATLDDDGFLTITDRLSRFSKIGGEMVPHRRVEEALQLASGEELQMCAVTGVPDDRRGEQLAVLHTIRDSAIPQLIAKAAAGGLPNLSCPRAAISSGSMHCRVRHRQAGPARPQTYRDGAIGRNVTRDECLPLRSSVTPPSWRNR